MADPCWCVDVTLTRISSVLIQPSPQQDHLPGYKPPSTPTSFYLHVNAAPSLSVTLEKPRLVAIPTQSLLYRATLDKSPHRIMTRPISVIAKFYDHRAMYTARQMLGIPNWNAERAEIYAKITDAEAEERLQRLSANLTAPESSEDGEMYDYFRGDEDDEDDCHALFERFMSMIAGRYHRADGNGPFIDNPHLDGRASLVADEELFIQRYCEKSHGRELRAYRYLRSEQGRVIPNLYDDLITHDLGNSTTPDSFLSRCHVLLLEDIPGLPVQDLLQNLKGGQDVAPLVKLGIASTNILVSNNIYNGDCRLRNMIYCTRSLVERRRDAEEYGQAEADFINRAVSTFPNQSLKHRPQQAPLHENISRALLDSTSAPLELLGDDPLLVIVDLESFKPTTCVAMLQLSTQEIINRFQQSLDSLAGRPGAYSHVQIYYDGRLGDIGDNQLERDALMATVWHNIQPMDTVGEYLTRYEVSQRAWQIVEQEFLKPQWWNFAIRRFATELFNENADHAEAVFQQGLQNHYQSASDVDSANNYSFAYDQADKNQDNSSDHSSEHSSDLSSEHVSGHCSVYSSDDSSDHPADECSQ
jgi:hypothetical protein